MERSGDRVVVRSGHGLVVDCSFRQSVCAFDVAGWHFGRTAGLLGTYDNEKANDLVASGFDASAAPAHLLNAADDAKAVAAFAHSWKVGRKECRPLNHAAVPPEINPKSTLAAEADELCESYFLVSEFARKP